MPSSSLSPADLELPRDPSIARRRVVIVDALGLQMRPADKFVTSAKTFRSDIAVTCRNFRTNGKSILDLETLAAVCGTTLDIEADLVLR